MNVARASLEELLLDYQDYLRTHNFELWGKDSNAAKAVRKLAYRSYETYESYRTYIENRYSGTVANIIICIIHQTNYLPDKLIRKLEREFIENGGVCENMYKARNSYRNRIER